jgi:hypothetical protein
MEQGAVVWRIVNDQYAHGEAASAWLKWSGKVKKS